MSERVGEAYIRITADTRAMRNALKRQAKRAAEQWDTEFGKTVERFADDRLARLRQDLARGLVDPKHFDSLRREFDSVGDAADSLRKRLDDIRKASEKPNSKDWKILRSEIDNWEKMATVRERLVQIERDHGEALRMNVQYDKDKAKAERDRIGVFKSLYAEMERALKIENDVARQRLVISREEERVAARNRQIDVAIERARDARLDGNERLRKSLDILWGHEDRYSSALRVSENWMTRWGSKLDRRSDKIVIFGSRVGRVFGKGSRNNFLNFIGSGIGSLFAPIRWVSEGFARVINLGGQLGATFSQLRAQGMSVAQAAGEMGMEFGAMAARALPVLLGGLAVLAAALPALVSGLLLLGGAVFSFFGSLTVGIIGGLLPLIPALVALAAGAGALALAFKDANKEGSEAAKAIERIKKSWGGVVEDFRKSGSDIPGTLADIADAALNRFARPLATGMGTAVRNVLTHLKGLVESPEMAQVSSTWGEKLPGIFEKWGRGFNSMLLGLMGFFTPILDFADRMGVRFEEMMNKFYKWATSVEGQNQIKQWMDQAWVAAGRLGDIIGNVIAILGSLFTSSDKYAGEGILAYLERITGEFRTWLSEPAGREAVKKFFEDSREVARKVKEIIEEIGRSIDNLDTDRARDDFKAILEVVRLIAGGIRIVAGILGAIGSSPGLVALIRVVDWLSSKSKPSVDFGTFDKLNSPSNKFLDKSNWWGRPGEGSTGPSSFGRFGGMVVPPPDDTSFMAKINAIKEKMSGLPAVLTAPLMGVGPLITGALAGVAGLLSTPFQQGSQQMSVDMSTFGSIVSTPLFGIGPTIANLLGPVPTLLSMPFQQGSLNAQFQVTSLPAIIGGLLGPVGATIFAAIGGVPAIFQRVFQMANTATGGRLGEIAGTISKGVADLPGRVRAGIQSIPAVFSSVLSGAVAVVSGIMGTIGGLIGGAISRASQAAATIRSALSIGGRAMASGGTVYGPTRALIGEAGPEAVVPLNRPLSLVDPSVRWLSAIAQGKTTAFASGGVAGVGKSVTVEPGAIVVQTSGANPALIAESVLDRFALAAF